MGFFEQLFKGKKSVTSPYAHFPEMPIVPMPLPDFEQKHRVVGQLLLNEKLGALTLARPERMAQLWHGKNQNIARFLALTRSNSTENYQWLLGRLGGEELINSSWEVIQNKQPVPGLGKKFSCLSFDFAVESRYFLRHHLYGDERQDIWQAYDEQTATNVLCFIIKPAEGKTKENFILRTQEKKDRLIADCYPGFLNVISEGTAKTAGAFACYRYKFPNVFYVVTEAPSIFKPAVTLIPKHLLREEQAVNVLYQVGRILACLHRAGWVHGYISPHHLWLEKPEIGQVTVYLDGFSLAKPQETCTILQILQQVTAQGAFLYLAPEQIEENITTAATDQFLLALSLYHLLTNKHPFAASTATLIRRRVKECSIPPIHKQRTDISENFSTILGRMLARNPGQRFKDFDEIIGQLDNFDESQFEEEIVVATIATKPAVEKSISNEAGDTTDQEEYCLLCYPYPPFQLAKDRKFHIGRDKSNDLILPSTDVSNSHAMVYWHNDGYHIKDLQSSNGTIVNAKNITQQMLNVGDEITIGTNTFFYERGSGDSFTVKVGDKPVKKQTMQMAMMRKKKRKDDTTTFNGDLSQISLWQILQMLAGEEKTGCLTLGEDSKETRIYFENGVIVHCDGESQTDEDAFYDVLYLQSGNFSFTAGQQAPTSTMNGIVESLLLEGARRYDEQLRQEDE